MRDKSTALVLVDWQQGFRDLNFWGQRCNLDAEANAARVISAWRAWGQPLYHVHHESHEPGSPLAADQSGCEPEPFAAAMAGEPRFAKSVNSGFIGTALEVTLREAGIVRLVVSGISTDHCVSTTVRMAANLGFEVLLVGDACFTFDRTTPNGQSIPAQQVHDVQLASLHGEFAQVVTTEGLIASLEHVAFN